MPRRPLRIATTAQLSESCRVAGFDTFVLPDSVPIDCQRSLEKRFADGKIVKPFLEKHDIELLIDFNTTALTLVPSTENDADAALATASLGIPYVSLYMDPITSTMAEVPWQDHWQLLENPTWIKAIPEMVHAEELQRLGVSNVIYVPMAIGENEFDSGPAPEPDTQPVCAFMGHPASSWFSSDVPFPPERLFPGLTAAAVRADMPDLAFHNIYYDLYEFAEPPAAKDEFAVRAEKAQKFYGDKFAFHAYLAIKQRDRFARFLKNKLGDAFELVGDFWHDCYGLKHTPRIWDRKVLYEKMRRTPINLNFVKGNWEAALILRHFEITACGGFMLAYPTAELGDFFDIGQECVVFQHEQDLLEKIDYYLTHPEERREIAAAGQRRTLGMHRYSHRIRDLVESLRRDGILPATITLTGQAAVGAAAGATATPSNEAQPAAPLGLGGASAG